MATSMTLPTLVDQVVPTLSGVQRPTRRRANELDGRTWTRYSISVWSDIVRSAEEKALKHPALFPVALPRRLIEMFTTSDDLYILDPFMGTGSTLVAAKQLGRVGIGF